MTGRSWPALLAAPLLALIEQSVVYALSTPTCSSQREAWLHAIPLAFLCLTLLLTAMAWVELRRLRHEGWGTPHTDADEGERRRHFVARLAVWLGALSSLVILALWIPQWVLSPCAA